MNGPEHYVLAEALLDSCQAPGGGDRDEQGRAVESYPTLEDVDGTQENACLNALLAAQVHATLALTAATMDVAGATSNGIVTTGWAEVLA